LKAATPMAATTTRLTKRRSGSPAGDLFTSAPANESSVLVVRGHDPVQMLRKPIRT